MKTPMSIRRLFSCLFILAAIAASFSAISAQPASKQGKDIFHEEELHYNVLYRWGIINKKAGEATLTLRHGPNSYISQLTARSMPWADKIFKVRDTLNGRMSYEEMLPLFYEKIANEASDRKHDVVNFNYTTPGKTTAACTRKVWRKGNLRTDEVKSMESERLALDMLSSFYFMRTLPFNEWQPGHVEVSDIFSGKQKETLSIVYSGITDIEINGVRRPTYHITFKFTSHGGKKTSDDMDAWISTDKSRIPLKLEGKLPIGKVHCLYIPQ